MTILMIGTTELLLVGGLALLLFGGKKLPEMMCGLGQGVREFKKGIEDVTSTSSTEQFADDTQRANNERIPFNGNQQDAKGQCD